MNTQEQIEADAVFKRLWPEGNAERGAFDALFDEYGARLMRDAVNRLEKKLQSGQPITNTIRYLDATARNLAEEVSKGRGAKDHVHARADGGDPLTPKPFLRYRDYWEHIGREIQRQFPDTPEIAEQRRREWEAYQKRKREMEEELAEELARQWHTEKEVD